MQEKLEQLKNKISEIDRILNLGELEKLEIKYLGRKAGELTLILKGLAKLPLEQKKKFGVLANQLKNEIKQKIEAKKKQLLGKGEKLDIDVTLPTDKDKLGHLHPISQVQYDLEDIFTSMGFMVLDGPELESEYYNFDALNIPASHPARDMQDTFYISQKSKVKSQKSISEGRLVLRTHTSPVQIRAMHKYGAPLRCVIPGRCYRNEATDVRHEHTFYQIEGLMLDKEISLSQMKGVLEMVGQFLYGHDTKLRLRPKFYPFVEPGVNGEFSCFLCQGKGCRLCKNSGWLEILGAGLVHSNVLRAGGIDPKKYSGFAFGIGLNRLAMLKYGIDDIRLFNSGDLRFLRQF